MYADVQTPVSAYNEPNPAPIESTADAACFYSLLASRLAIGDQVSPVARLNFRDSNLAIIGSFSASDSVSIIDGPVCRELNGRQYRFWTVQADSGETGLVAENDSYEYLLRLTHPDPEQQRIEALESTYTTPVLQGCNYQRVQTTQLVLQNRQYDQFEPDVTPAEVFNLMGSWKGRNLWRGYSHGGYSLPTDIRRVATLFFTITRNLVNGLYLNDDPVQVWFYYSSTNDEIYLLPFRSLQKFGLPDGSHYDAHLCGIYAMSPGNLAGLESLFTVPSSL